MIGTVKFLHYFESFTHGTIGCILDLMYSRSIQCGVNALDSNQSSMISRKYNIIHVNNGITSECRMECDRGWAYQQCYLNQRLRVQREHRHLLPIASPSPEHGLFDRDRIMLLEHNHVYSF